MPSKAHTAARAARPTVDKKVPAYAPPTAPANITHAVITRGEAKAISPTHPLGTVKEA